MKHRHKYTTRCTLTDLYLYNTTPPQNKLPAAHGQTVLCTAIPHRYKTYHQLHTDRLLSVPQYNTATQYTASCTLTHRSLYLNTTPLYNTPPAAHWQTALCTAIPHRYTTHHKLHTDRPPSVPQYHTAIEHTTSCTLTDRSLYCNTTPLHHTPPAAHRQTALCTAIPHRYTTHHQMHTDRPPSVQQYKTPNTIHHQLHTDRPLSVPLYHTAAQYTISCTLTDRSLYRNTTPL